MKKGLCTGLVLTAVAVFLCADVAQAQRRGGGGWGGGRGSWGGGRGWEGGRSWEGGRGWDGGWGGGWGWGGYYGGYYGRPYYGNGWNSGYSSYYYGPGYDYSYSQPYYGASPYTLPDVGYAQAETPVTQQSYYPNQSDNRARLRVVAPSPDATILVEGQRTNQSGTDRTFFSPPLDPGKTYTYTVRAEWNQGGRTVNREKVVDVRAGQETVVRFDEANNTSNTLNTTGRDRP